MLPGMVRTILTLLLFAVPASAHATPVDSCESSIETAASKFLQCRLTAESKYTRTLDDPVRLAARVKCSDKFLTAVISAKSRSGASSCTAVSGEDLQGYMAACSDAVEFAAGLDGSIGCVCPTPVP